MHRKLAIFLVSCSLFACAGKAFSSGKDMPDSSGGNSNISDFQETGGQIHNYQQTEYQTSHSDGGSSSLAQSQASHPTGGSSALSLTTRPEGGSSSVNLAGGTSANNPSGGSDAGLMDVDIPCSLPKTDLNGIRMEADYIRSCQYLPTDHTDSAYGAINSYIGSPTWIVPGEMAVAGIGLLRAFEILNDDTYRSSAVAAADYLVRIQDQIVGGWHNQYDHSSIQDKGMALRHTAEVLVFFDALGYDENRATSMLLGGSFVRNCMNPNNKLGKDDGLVGAGKDAKGVFQTWRWLSDNAYAYRALQAAAAWQDRENNIPQADDFRDGAARILSGIKTYFLDASKTHWKRVIDKDDNLIVSESFADWIGYAPLMLDLPLEDISSTDVGDWIHETLQKENGSLISDTNQNTTKQSPGFSFQATLAWINSGQCPYSAAALNWSTSSGLWQQKTDTNGATGGWIDWKDSATGSPAPFYERFIDTSAYYILAQTGGLSFTH